MPESNGKVTRLDHDWLEDYLAYATPAHLLYGLALEIAIKAWIIQKKPEAVQFEVVIDAKQNITKASLKGFGGNTRNWHALVSLADVARLFDEGFAQQSDRDMLHYFTDSVVWLSKYPIPKESFEEVKRNSLYAVKDAERWLTNVHPNPLPPYNGVLEHTAK